MVRMCRSQSSSLLFTTLRSRKSRSILLEQAPHNRRVHNRVQIALIVQMRSLGFEGFAIDYIDAEPGVIAFLNMICRFNTTVSTLLPSAQILIYRRSRAKEAEISIRTRRHTLE